MTMTYSTIGGTTLATGVTTVECQKQVRSWRLLRYLMEFLIPSCNCTTFIDEKDFVKEENYIPSVCYRQPIFSSSSSNTITGTIFGYRRGKVRFCIQADSKSTNPILLLDLAVPTAFLAREMQGGLLRMALESTTLGHGGNTQSLMSTPVWTMYCNGRRVGYAVKRKISKADMDLLRMMDSVVVGAGVISGKELDHDDELTYLRASFKRVCGSSDSESYHLMDPDGNIGQELSIFFFRSR